MTRVVLSIGSNLGDRMARLQAVIDGLAQSVRAVSPVYETAAWGGVEQGPFLNAVIVADDPDLDERGWLRRAQQLEDENGRVREVRWGPRTLDVDLISCHPTGKGKGHEIIMNDESLVLPHPMAHQRAFVLIPWLAVDPDAELAVIGDARRVDEWLGELDPAECAGVRLTGFVLDARKYGVLGYGEPRT